MLYTVVSLEGLRVMPRGMTLRGQCALEARFSLDTVLWGTK